MSVGTGQRHVSEERHAKPVGVPEIVAFTHPPDIARRGVEPSRPARAKLWKAQRMESLAAEERTAMAVGTARVAEKQLHSPKLPRGQRAALSLKVSIEGTVVIPEFSADEGSDRIRDFDDCHVRWIVDIFEGVDEEPPVFPDSTDSFGYDRPCVVHTLPDRPGDLVFARLAGHFRVGRHREKSLRGEKRVESPGKEFLSGRVETVIVEPGGADAPVMEHEPHLMRAEVP